MRVPLFTTTGGRVLDPVPGEDDQDHRGLGQVGGAHVPLGGPDDLRDAELPWVTGLSCSRMALTADGELPCCLGWQIPVATLAIWASVAELV